ncbi:hypothetical protein CDL15_Pgr008105 [Punica granatum]|uniref:Exostosin GT47 domain-containing protein n=1 Tax=Punica granatum TaxID=22663 RepID=A0A218W2S4_PUNGR|nr:hypothetical protein CDL15_Pgr008105 [Punica granatum]
MVGEAEAPCPTVARWKSTFLLALFFAVWILILHSFQRSPDNVGGHGESCKKESHSPSSPACTTGMSVYVYDLPAKFNSGLLEDYHHLNIYTDMCPYVAKGRLGQPIQELSLSWPAYSTPHSTVGCIASSKFHEQNLTLRDALAVELVQYLDVLPWWQRNGGRDHFLALVRTAWDFMRKPSQGPKSGANVLLNLPAVSNMSVLTVERQPWGPVDLISSPSLGGGKGLQKATIRDELIKQCAGSSKSRHIKCVGGQEDSYEYSVFIDAKGGRTLGMKTGMLSKIGRDKEEKMRNKVIELIPRLTFAHPNATNLGFKDDTDVTPEALSDHVRSQLSSQVQRN